MAGGWSTHQAQCNQLARESRRRRIDACAYIFPVPVEGLLMGTNFGACTVGWGEQCEIVGRVAHPLLPVFNMEGRIRFHDRLCQGSVSGGSLSVTRWIPLFNRALNFGFLGRETVDISGTITLRVDMHTDNRYGAPWAIATISISGGISATILWVSSSASLTGSISLSNFRFGRTITDPRLTFDVSVWVTLTIGWVSFRVRFELLNTGEWTLHDVARAAEDAWNAIYCQTHCWYFFGWRCWNPCWRLLEEAPTTGSAEPPAGAYKNATLAEVPVALMAKIIQECLKDGHDEASLAKQVQKESSMTLKESLVYVQAFEGLKEEDAPTGSAASGKEAPKVATASEKDDAPTGSAASDKEEVSAETEAAKE